MANTKPTTSTLKTRGANKIPNPQKSNNDPPKKGAVPPKPRQPKNKKTIELKDVTCQTDIFDEANKLALTNQESEINGLRLENCVLKNLTDDLRKKLEQEKSQVTDASQHVTQLNQKLETVSAQLKLSQDLINLNSKLKLENDKLRLQINDANKAILRSEKLQSMMDSLDTKVQKAEKTLLENASLKLEVESLRKENFISKESLKNLKDILSKTSHDSVNKTDESKGAGEKRRQPKRKDNFGYENSDQMQHQQEPIKKLRKGTKTSHSDQYTNHPQRVYPNRNNTEGIDMNYTAVRPQDQYYLNPTRNVHGKQPQNQQRNACNYR